MSGFFSRKRCSTARWAAATGPTLLTAGTPWATIRTAPSSEPAPNAKAAKPNKIQPPALRDRITAVIVRGNKLLAPSVNQTHPARNPQDIFHEMLRALLQEMRAVGFLFRDHRTSSSRTGPVFQRESGERTAPPLFRRQSKLGKSF